MPDSSNASQKPGRIDLATFYIIEYKLVLLFSCKLKLLLSKQTFPAKKPFNFGNQD